MAGSSEPATTLSFGHGWKQIQCNAIVVKMVQAKYLNDASSVGHEIRLSPHIPLFCAISQHFPL